MAGGDFIVLRTTPPNNGQLFLNEPIQLDMSNAEDRAVARVTADQRDDVLATRETRAKAARKAGNSNYRQYAVEGADHFFVGTEDELVRRVYGWLKRNFENPRGSRS